MFLLIIISVPPSSLSLSLSIGIVLNHDFGENWFRLLTFPILVGVTTAHFPGGDQIIAHLHSIFILVQVLLHFPWARIDFDRSPSSSGGGHNRSLSWWGSHHFLASAAICAVFWVNLDYLPSRDRRSWVDRLACTPCAKSVTGLNQLRYSKSILTPLPQQLDSSKYIGGTKRAQKFKPTQMILRKFSSVWKPIELYILDLDDINFTDAIKSITYIKEIVVLNVETWWKAM